MALSMSWGSSWRYLVRHAEEGGSERERTKEDNYYLRAAEHGEPPGVWLGRGIESLGLSGEVQRHEMETVYGKLLHPTTGEALGSPARKYATEEARLELLLAREVDPTPERIADLKLEARKSNREARHYADLTHSPSKSWSILQAALESTGRDDEAAIVWESILVGVEASLEFLQREAGYSRAGYHGAVVAGRTSGRWVDAHDWVMSAWRHHTSRDGDPQIHVHVAVLNRVLSDDGVWRTLDSKAITRARPAAEAIFHRVAEQELTRRLGVEFQTRPDGVAREIVGISPEIRDLFSSRRRAITAEVAELAAAFQERHGKAPTPYQLTLMAEHATLKTRARKPEYGPTRLALFDDWEKSAKGLGTTLADVLKGVEMDTDKVRSTDVDFDAVISQALARLDQSKSTWTRYDLIAQLDRYLPDSVSGLDARAVETLLGQLADKALNPGGAVLCLTAPELVAAPAQLRRKDGHSIYEPYGAERYATVAQLSREERLVAMAHTTGGRRLSVERADKLVDASGLGGDQAKAAKEILRSNRRIEVLVGPAGTGKSYTMGEIATIWEAEGGKVLGLTVSEAASQVLGAEGLDRAANLARFLKIQERITEGRASRAERRDYTLTQRSLVILDEASMMPTADLARVIELTHNAGGKVLVTGDGRQLQAVGAGGGMNLLVRELGAHELTEVHRFEAEWEGAASLRLRDGDASVLVEYDRRGRFVEGTSEEVAEAAYLGYMGDYLDGKATMLVTSSNAQAAELSSTVRADLVHMGKVEEQGVALHNHTVAGRGDLVQTRHNDRKIVDLKKRPVVNRDVYTVLARTGDDSLRVRRQLGASGELGPAITLPANYVREHVELAYASTAHSAQGRTVDTCHAVVDESTDRAALYVAMTRGRAVNIAYVVTRHLAEEFSEEITRDRMAVVASILERQDGVLSATELLAEELAASESLARLGPIWADCVAEDSRLRYDDVLTRVLGPERAAKVRADDAAGPLWRLLRTAELDGHRPEQLLSRVVAKRELDTADSIAEVLHYRVTRALDAREDQQVRPQVTRRTFSERTPEPEGLEPFGLQMTGQETTASFARRLAAAMDRRASDLGDQAAASPPAWAKQLGHVPANPVDRAEWTQRAAVVGAYREQYVYDSPADPIGAAPSRGGDPDRRAAWEQAWTALGQPGRNRDVARLNEGELRHHVTAYEREEAWAPPYPDEELRQAHSLARYWSRQATLEKTLQHSPLWRKPAPVRQEKLDAERSSAEVLARQFAENAAQLEKIATARAEWHEHTAEKRELAHRAAEELARRRVGDRLGDERPDEVQIPQRQEQRSVDLTTTAGLAQALEQAKNARLVIDERRSVDQLEAQLRQEYVVQQRQDDDLNRGLDRRL